MNETSLNQQQKRELSAHLKACPACSSLAEVGLSLRAVQMAEPAPGFTARFQVRLAQHKRALSRRNVLGFILLGVSVIGLLTGLAWPLLRQVVESPLAVFSSWLSSLAGFWASLQALLHAGSVLFRVAPGFVPVYIWAIVLFGLAGWSLAWVFSLIRFTRVRRVQA